MPRAAAVRGRRMRTYRLQVSLGTLRRPLRPRLVVVRADRRASVFRWTYDRRTKVLRLRVRLKRSTVTVRR